MHERYLQAGRAVTSVPEREPPIPEEVPEPDQEPEQKPEQEPERAPDREPVPAAEATMGPLETWCQGLPLIRQSVAQDQESECLKGFPIADEKGT